MIEGHAPALEAVEGNGEERGRRRRRGRGGRGGERGERGDRPERSERPPRGEESSPQQDEKPQNRELFGHTDEPAKPEPALEAASHGEPTPRPEHRARAEQPTEPAETIAAKPVKPAIVPPTPPAAFHEVRQHEEVAEEPHKPVRKRRHAADNGGEEQPAPLQLVETQVEAPIVATDEDEPRRPVRRRRRGGGSAEAEPLMLVETQQGVETSRPDAQP